jgi:tetratricopeptide (TPR) repeat protein
MTSENNHLVRSKRTHLASKTHLALWAAVVGLPILAFGQQHTGSDGHALDANNQIGSGGSNVVMPPNGQVTGNQILTGNVSGGYQFRGRNFKGLDLGVGYTDPTAWRGLLPGQMVDQFIRQSNGVPTSGNATNNLSRGPVAFYGRANTVTVPLGYVPQPNGGYVPSNSISAPPLQDTRLDALMAQSDVAKPDELLLPGAVDMNADTIFTASPLYGTRQWQLNEESQNLFAPETTSSEFTPMGPVERQRAQQMQVQKLRKELQGPDNGTTGNNPTGAPNGIDYSNPAGSGSGSNNPTYNNPLGTKPLSSAVAGSDKPLAPLTSGTDAVASVNLAPMAGKTDTGQSNRQFLAPVNIPPAAQQSAQFAELRKRLDQYNNSHPQNDEDANREYNAALQARRILINGAANPGTPAVGSPNGAGQNAGPTPGAIGAGRAPEIGGLPTPMQVGKLEDGTKSPGMRKLIAQGEDFVQQQQYSKAIDVYDQAIAVAPNNPLLLIGRSEAELGGAFYSQAQADLRTAIKQDHAVLMAQYDLQKHLGDARLQAIVADLKKIASDNPANPTPVFLLAYIAYNTHHEDQAAAWLDVAQKRSDGKDDVIPLLQKYWTLSAPTTRP